jgi:glutathione S-transferase
MIDSADDLVLYHTPGACSRVTMCALEELEIAFEDRPVDIFKGAQFSPQYRAVNPKGKVPALLIGEQLLTETPAIILWLTEIVPGELLLPGTDPLARAQAFSDLAWCSNTLHPLARTIRMPQRMTSGAPEDVRGIAVASILPMLEAANTRLADQTWWFGDRWSVVDVYFSWVVGMCMGAGVDLGHLPALANHLRKVRERPNFVRTLARETRALETAGIELPGGGRL